MARGRRVPTAIKKLEGEPHKDRMRELAAEQAEPQSLVFHHESSAHTELPPLATSE